MRASFKGLKHFKTWKLDKIPKLTQQRDPRQWKVFCHFARFSNPPCHSAHAGKIPCLVALSKVTVKSESSIDQNLLGTYIFAIQKTLQPLVSQGVLICWWEVRNEDTWNREHLAISFASVLHWDGSQPKVPARFQSFQHSYLSVLWKNVREKPPAMLRTTTTAWVAPVLPSRQHEPRAIPSKSHNQSLSTCWKNPLFGRSKQGNRQKRTQYWPEFARHIYTCYTKDPAAFGLPGCAHMLMRGPEWRYLE